MAYLISPLQNLSLLLSNKCHKACPVIKIFLSFPLLYLCHRNILQELRAESLFSFWRVWSMHSSKHFKIVCNINNTYLPYIELCNEYTAQQPGPSEVTTSAPLFWTHTCTGKHLVQCSKSTVPPKEFSFLKIINTKVWKQILTPLTFLLKIFFALLHSAWFQPQLLYYI